MPATAPRGGIDRTMRRASTFASLLAAAAVVGTALPGARPGSRRIHALDQGGRGRRLAPVRPEAGRRLLGRASRTSPSRSSTRTSRRSARTSWSPASPARRPSCCGPSPTTSDRSRRPAPSWPSTASSTPTAYLPNAVAAVQAGRRDLGRADLVRQPPDAVHQQGPRAECPADSDALIAAAKANTGDGNYGLVFNQTESFWLVPFLGAFGGSVFARGRHHPDPQHRGDDRRAGLSCTASSTPTRWCRRRPTTTSPTACSRTALRAPRRSTRAWRRPRPLRPRAWRP